MRLEGLEIGFAMTGSHCQLQEVLPEVKKLVEEGARVIPVVSEAVGGTDTKYGRADYWKGALQEITGEMVIGSIVEAEPIGPGKLLDILVVAPCTGNTLAKLANGITDSPVLMAIKAQLRNQRPVVLAVSTNDGLSMNAKNLGLILNARNIYMVPFGQDNPESKPTSLVARMGLITETVVHALAGKQVQPLLVTSYTV
ncbi:MAG: dipicolinate synthase subunit B [Peptococcaceae bacterium]|nr:dipicolinate synthase subunit B [Peptococcaceae bacterium]